VVDTVVSQNLAAPAGVVLATEAFEIDILHCHCTASALLQRTDTVFAVRRTPGL
jgi:hypothetical protein